MNNQTKFFMVLHFRMLRTLILFLVFAGFAFQFPLSPAFAEKSPDEILAGVHRNFPPQYSIDEKTGKPTGFAIDIMDEVARRAGLKIRYVVFDEWPPLTQALIEGRIDIIPNNGIIEERKADIDFTDPVEAFNISIFVRETTTDIHGIDDLQKRRVAVVRDNVGLLIIQEYGKAKPVIFKSLDESLLSLLSGNTDALVYPEPPVLLITSKSKLSEHIKTAGKPLLEVKRAIAVGKGKTDLLKKLDTAVKELIPTQTYKEIYARWHLSPAPYWDVRRVLIAAAIVLVLVILIFAGWHYLFLRRLNRDLKHSLEEQKKAKEMIQDSEELFRVMASSTPDHVLLQDSDLRYSFVMNPQMGLTEQDMIGKTDYDLLSKEDADELTEIKRQVLKTGSPVHVEVPITSSTGEQQFFDGSYIPKFDAQGRIDGLIGYFRNITERKRVEKALHEYRQLLENTFASLDQALFVVDPQTRNIIACNPATEHIFGYALEDIIGRNTEFLHVDKDMYQEFGQRLFQALDAEGIFRTEFLMRRKDGTVFPTENTVSEMKDEHGQRVGVVSVVRDITERRRAEDKLRQSGELFSKAFLASPSGMAITRIADGKFINANESFLSMFEFSHEEMIGHTSTELKMWSPEEREKLIAQQLASGGLRNFELSVRSKSGRFINLLFSSKQVELDGEACHITTFVDITDRKRAEEALQKSEERFRELVETINDVFYELDEQGIIQYVSPSIELLFGYNQAETIGRSITEFLVPEDTVSAVKNVQNVMVGHVAPNEYHIRHKSGKLGWIRVSSSPVVKGDQVVGIRGVLSDITERKHVEEKLRTSHQQLRALAERLHKIREEERITISREIHDTMGGGLTGLKMDLSWLMHNVKKAESDKEQAALMERFLSTNENIDNMIKVTRRLSTGLRPPVLDDLGLIAALEWQLSDLTSRTGIPHELATAFEYVSMEKDKAVAVFRIFQEALINVIRHSRATKVVVILREEDERSLFGDENLVLEIRDNGRGITEEEIINKESLGLLGMKERAFSFGGELSIRGEPGGGTVVVLKIPRKQGEQS